MTRTQQDIDNYRAYYEARSLSLTDGVSAGEVIRFLQSFPAESIVTVGDDVEGSFLCVDTGDEPQLPPRAT